MVYMLRSPTAFPPPFGDWTDTLSNLSFQGETSYPYFFFSETDLTAFARTHPKNKAIVISICLIYANRSGGKSGEKREIKNGEKANENLLSEIYCESDGHPSSGTKYIPSNYAVFHLCCRDRSTCICLPLRVNSDIFWHFLIIFIPPLK